MTSAANYFRQKGGVVFASAGNSGSFESTPENPARITVSATTSSNTIASWSSYGNYVDVAAPGAGIVTTARGGGYASVSGTSFSSPAAAGVGALVFSVQPTLTPNQVENILKQTAVDLGTAGWDTFYGHGRVEAHAAVLAALEIAGVDTQSPTVAITSPTPGTTVFGTVAVDVAASDNVGVERVELYANGQLVAEASEAPYAFSLNTLNFDDGALTLTAKAWDQAGNSCTSGNVTVTVDNVPDPVDQTPPQVKILSPTDGSNVSNKVTISISATDDVKVASLKCYIDGVLKASTTGSALKYTWFARKPAAGAHTIQAVAADTSGDTGTANVQVQVIK